MADTTLNIPDLNPVKFYSETLTYPVNYRSRFMDDFNFQNQLRDFEYKVKYNQKWMLDDIIHLFMETDFTDLKVHVIGCDENIYKTYTPAVVTSAINPSPLDFRSVSITLDDLTPGIYYLRIQVTLLGAKKNYDSEPFELSELVENSVLLHYSNETNDYDVAFDTGIVFALRVEGGLSTEGYRPGSKRKVYEDQNLNAVRLSATPFETERLVIGGSEGVPKWVIKLVNAIFCCDYTTIDGKQYVRMEGEIEPKREENYPMAGWSFDVREAKNKYSNQFKVIPLFGVLDYDGALLRDYDNEPILYK